MSEDDIVFPEPETTKTLVMVDPERLQQIERKAAAYDALRTGIYLRVNKVCKRYGLVPWQHTIHIDDICIDLNKAERIANGEESQS